MKQIFYGCCIYEVNNGSSPMPTKYMSINPLLPIVAFMQRSAKILILIYEGITQKISSERRDYESVDKKSLS